MLVYYISLLQYLSCILIFTNLLVLSTYQNMQVWHNIKPDHSEQIIISMIIRFSIENASTQRQWRSQTRRHAQTSLKWWSRATLWTGGARASTGSRRTRWPNTWKRPCEPVARTQNASSSGEWGIHVNIMKCAHVVLFECVPRSVYK